MLSSTIQQRRNEADPEWVESRRATNERLLERFPILRKLQSALDGPKSPQASGKWRNKPMIWLLGKLPEEPRQRNDESKIEDEIAPTTRRLELANRILLAGSDSQTFTGNYVFWRS
jgi:hypothetical protein